MVGALLVAVLVAVIVAERVAEARRRTRGELSPIERLDASPESQLSGAIVGGSLVDER
ncbi:MAG: hypothetical protein H0U05_13775 [Actinobacteria bacterium]|nr:hypothetical protein [Actinomycetota bacterium]